MTETQTLILNGALCLFAVGIWAYIITKSILRRRTAKAAARTRALLDDRILELGDRLRHHGVNQTPLDLDVFADARWTPEDIDLLHTEVGGDPELLRALLDAADSATTTKDPTPLTVDGVAHWARLGMHAITDSPLKEWESATGKFNEALRPMTRYAAVGDHTYSAWAYAAKMSASEAAVMYKRNEPLDAIKTLAALSGTPIDHPVQPAVTDPAATP